MWTIIAIISVLAALTVLAARLVVARRRTPHPDDRDRQHVVPGAERDGPPPPDRAQR